MDNDQLIQGFNCQIVQINVMSYEFSVSWTDKITGAYLCLCAIFLENYKMLCYGI